MKRQEVQRRILDLLVRASDQNVKWTFDHDLARELGVDKRIVQGNLQLLEEVGYVQLGKESSFDGGLLLLASLSPTGYVLLHDPDDDPPNVLPLAKAVLAVMEKQVAGFGELYAPPYLVVQLEEQRRIVAALEAGKASE